MSQQKFYYYIPIFVVSNSKQCLCLFNFKFVFELKLEKIFYLKQSTKPNIDEFIIQ